LTEPDLIESEHIVDCRDDIGDHGVGSDTLVGGHFDTQADRDGGVIVDPKGAPVVALSVEETV
jgi:hypothetical protein